MNALPPASTIPFSLCVYCGSRTGSDAQFARAADAVGHWLGQQGGRLVYGGGNNGLMGRVAHAVLEAGGTVLGIIPQALVNLEVAKTDCTELKVVQTMHERKALMMENADAFLALPGGIGTFEELFEVWAWRQLGYHSKPMGLLNINSYYDQLLGFLAHSVESGFVSDHQMNHLLVDSQHDPLLVALQRAAANQPHTVHTTQI